MKDGMLVIRVADSGEWATVVLFERFWPGTKGLESKWSCEMLIHSSFGAYGYYWSNLSEPCVLFLVDADTDYLLGKIGSKVSSAEKIRDSLLKEIREAESCTDTERVTAEARVNELYADHFCNADVFAHQVYEDDDIHEVIQDYSDIDSQDWEPQVRQFMLKLWPRVVEKLRMHKSPSPPAPSE